MQFMVIEKFYQGKVKLIYERLSQKGRMMPEGVEYVNSWIDITVSTCYQVMQSDSKEKIFEWISCWNDLADFEVIPVISSAEAKNIVLSS